MTLLIKTTLSMFLGCQDTDMSVRLQRLSTRLGGVKKRCRFWRVSSCMKPISNVTREVAHTMDLYGRAESSRLMLWRPAAQVMPVSAFELVEVGSG
jgi:hypothetical protein